MTLLSRKVDYALLILSYLYHHSAGGSAREIAGRFGLSRGFVANILKSLCSKGFVASHRGVKGGYVLSVPASDINMTDLMDALDETFHLTECNRKTDREDPCTVLHVCPVRAPLAEVNQRIRQVLENVRLDELFRMGEKGENGQALPVIPLAENPVLVP